MDEDLTTSQIQAIYSHPGLPVFAILRVFFVGRSHFFSTLLGL